MPVPHRNSRRWRCVRSDWLPPLRLWSVNLSATAPSMKASASPKPSVPALAHDPNGLAPCENRKAPPRRVINRIRPTTTATAATPQTRRAKPVDEPTSTTARVISACTPDRSASVVGRPPDCGSIQVSVDQDHTEPGMTGQNSTQVRTVTTTLARAVIRARRSTTHCSRERLTGQLTGAPFLR
jgi:hypothetical protein